MAQGVKNLPAMQETQETQVQSLGQENPLEEEMATHSSIFAWRIQWTKEPGGFQSMGLQRVGNDLAAEQLCQYLVLLVFSVWAIIVVV